MEKKETNIINMVLTCAILFLAVSIALYLFTLRPRNHKDGQDSGPSEDETVSAAATDSVSGSPAKAQLPPEEQLSLYRQFLLRGDLMRGYNKDASKLRYRFYDIDHDGIFELFFATPSEHGTVVGSLWLDDNHNVDQSAVSASKDSSAMIGEVWLKEKCLEANYIDHSTADPFIQWWMLYDPEVKNNLGSERVVSRFGYDIGTYRESMNHDYQISEDEFPQFYEQVNIIIGTGPMFDPYAQTVSYEELIGSETPDPKFTGYTEYDAVIHWVQNKAFPANRTLTLSPFNAKISFFPSESTPSLPAPDTFAVADDAVIHVIGADGDEIGWSYNVNSLSLDEYIEDYNRAINGQEPLNVSFSKQTDEQGIPYAIGFGHAHVQIQNGEIKEIWMNPIQWG